MQHRTDPTVLFNDGNGLLAVGEERLLYVADRHHPVVQELTRSFINPTGDFRGLVSAISAYSFDIPALFAAALGPPIQGFVFGDPQVRLDGLAVKPSTTGSELDLENTTVVDVGSFDTSDEFELVTGRAPAGSLRLTLRSTEQQEFVTASAGTTDKTANEAGNTNDSGPVAPADMPVPGDPSLATRDDDAAAIVDDSAVPPDPALLGLTHAASEPPAAPQVSSELVDAPTTEEVLDPGSAAPTLDIEALAPPVVADPTIPAPPAQAPVDLPADPIGGIGTYAAMCPCGIANPPSAQICRACESSLQRPGITFQSVPQPLLGHLALDDGTSYPLDRSYVVGRQPSVDGTDCDSPIKVDSPKRTVSKSHAAIRVLGFDVEVADLDSANGTFVDDGAGRPLQKLRAGAPMMVDIGATIRMGDRQARIVGLEGE